MNRIAAVAAASALAFVTGAAFAQGQGVTKTEIVIGSMQDMSGPIVGFSKQLKFGMEMRVDEINAAGGIGGKKIALTVEDTAASPTTALNALNRVLGDKPDVRLSTKVATAALGCR